MGIPEALAIAGIAGAGLSAAGATESGEATNNAMNYQAAVAKNNASIGRQNAAWDVQAGETAASNTGLKTKAVIGSQRAGASAGGVDSTTGSEAAIQTATGEGGMMDALTRRSDAARKAYAEEVGATSQDAQAQLDIAGGQQAEEAGFIGAGSSLLSGASTVGGNYGKWKQAYGGSGGGPADVGGGVDGW